MVHLPDTSHGSDDAPETSAAAADAPVTPETRRLEPAAPAPAAGAAKDVPRPIGREKLRALREAIRNGTYPTDADVMGGLVRMFRETDDPKPAP